MTDAIIKLMSEEVSEAGIPGCVSGMSFGSFRVYRSVVLNGLPWCRNWRVASLGAKASVNAKTGCVLAKATIYT